MLADSVKVKGFSCFKENWVEFDEFKPITVIIGRNNSGKSHLIDLVDILTSKGIESPNFSLKGAGILDADFLTNALSLLDVQQRIVEGFTGATPQENPSDALVSTLTGRKIRWEYEPIFEICKATLELHGEIISDEVKKSISSKLTSVNTVLGGTIFRRIAADRDINQEFSGKNIALSSNGEGATNTVRRYLNTTSDSYPEELIKEKLLDGLKCIFGGDGDFKNIKVKEHDETEEGEEKWEIYLYEEGKPAAPLSKSGSGLKTVILVLLNLLVIPNMEKKPKSDYVFAFEELENNLHPALLRRLFDYLKDYVKEHKCHLFLTTHSSVALDYFSTLEEAQIIQVTHDGTSASAKTIEAHFDKVGVLNDLGAKPSDLLQANGIIWLEGPSDRIYLNKFIELYSDGKLREGRDYQCAFYGGSVLANTSFSTPEEENDHYANLLRLNHNVVVVCDSDTTYEDDDLKPRVLRIQEEVKEIPENAYLWITEPKEIENYIPAQVWSKEYGKEGIPDPEGHDRFPSAPKEGDYLHKHFEVTNFRKTKIAANLVPHFTKENLADRFELKVKMEELVETIKKWNN